ncbi:hypothetical protein KGF54_002439 [Candida jiufengensis]|uniref:uncharacterized protein n=1 Tax=Candida jiufengensis TaxID=497108 RepID=UPI00222551E0|nr:uncharacterized protein KGF54_002439 [Candida jiufengensis]KAI5954663.1 hypothetical protein KGF54_002439 [Candida jiufengensis]
MSTSVLNLDLNQGDKPKKRKYSSLGCRECKRRKIKCDEKHPACWQCTRLKKDCSYPEIGEKVLRVSKKKQKLQELEQVEQQQFQQHPQHQQQQQQPNQIYNNQPHHHLQPPLKIEPRLFEERQPINLTQQQHQQQQQPLQPPQPQPQQTQLQQTHSFDQALTYRSGPPPYSNQTILPNPYSSRTNQYQPFQHHLLNPQDQQHVNLPPPNIPNALLYRKEVPKGSSNLVNLLNKNQDSYNNHNNNNSNGNSSLKNCCNESPTNTTTTTTSISPPFFNDDLIEVYEVSDLNLLASDLHNMVNGILYNMTDSAKAKSSETQLKSQQQNIDNVGKNLPVDFIKLEDSKNQIYMKEFYYNFANVVLPFSSYDEENKILFNPARDILLTSAAHTDYVLAAVLANGAWARFDSTQNPEDEEYYYLYLNDCLKMLSPAIADDSKLGLNIESILLTVLLLTAANAANPKQDWRPHLRGAKDLLMKSSHKKLKYSKTFVFCKCWFVTLEILASVSSKKGGTLHTDEEIDEIINLSSNYEKKILKDLGLVLSNGFNIMGGYKHEVYCLFRDLMKTLNKIRNNSFDPKESLQYINLFCKLNQQVNVFDKNTIPVSDQNIRWLEISHKTYVYAALITVLTTCFEETFASPQVQVLTNEILKSIEFINDYEANPDHKEIMFLQWPMLVAGTNLVDETKRDFVKKFFQLSSKVGSGGALIALKRIDKIWAKRDGKPLDSDGYESEDLVSY